MMEDILATPELKDLMVMAEAVSEVKPLMYLEKQHQWPSLARDIAMMVTPDAGSTVTPEILLAVYGMSPEEFHIVQGLPLFESMLREELAKIKEGGSDICHKYRMESMVARLGDVIYSRCVNEKGTEVKDMTAFYRTLLESLGMIGGKAKKEVTSAQAQVAIQFNLPDLKNHKLDHLKMITQEA